MAAGWGLLGGWAGRAAAGAAAGAGRRGFGVAAGGVRGRLWAWRRCWWRTAGRLPVA